MEARFANSLLRAELVTTQSGLWPAPHPITPPLFRCGPCTTRHERVPRHPIGALASESTPPPRPHSTGRLPIRCRIPAGRNAGQPWGKMRKSLGATTAVCFTGAVWTLGATGVGVVGWPLARPEGRRGFTSRARRPAVPRSCRRVTEEGRRTETGSRIPPWDPWGSSSTLCPLGLSGRSTDPPIRPY